MKRVLTATCLAAVCAVGLAAQQTTTPTQEPTGRAQRGGPRTVTGCVRAGDKAGTYILTDIQMARPGETAGSTAGGTTAGGTTAGGTTAGGTTGGTGTGTEATAGTQGRGQMPTSITLNPSADVDLKPHVGHKIEVTGTMAGRARRGGGDETTPGTTGSTGATATGGGATTTGGATAGGGQTAGQTGGRTPTMSVTSVRMISESCS